MIVYKYDQTTKEFAGEHICQPSPLEKGVFLKPDNSTESEPPIAQENKSILFDDGWILVDDYRGEPSYDDTGKSSVISELSELPKPEPEGFIKPSWIDGEWVESALATEIADHALNLVLQKRASEYPDPMILNDARAKQVSTDPDIQAEGVAQEEQYYQDCLAVKDANPKPEV